MAVLSAGVADAGILGVAALAEGSAVRADTAARVPAAVTYTAILRRRSAVSNLPFDTSVLPDLRHIHRIGRHELLT
jgi:hypothetical protein